MIAQARCTLFGTLALAVALSVVPAAAQDRLPDGTVETVVAPRLAARGLDGAVTVEAVDGVVTLTGTVETLSEKMIWMTLIETSTGQIIGTTRSRMRCNSDAPSSSAAWCSSSGMPSMAASRTIIGNPAYCQMQTTMMAGSESSRLPSQGCARNPSPRISRLVLSSPKFGS